MSRGWILFTAMVIVLAGSAVVALIWWSLADKFFPGAARSTGQGLPRESRKDEPRPRVVRDFPPSDEDQPDPGKDA